MKRIKNDAQAEFDWAPPPRPPRMPKRLFLASAGAAILLAVTVLTGLYLGSQTQQRLEAIGSSWQLYTEEAERRGALLSRLRGHLGYGGIIHNFKNYVLRQDGRYLELLQRQIEDFARTIKEYRQSGASPMELDHLAAIEKTVDTYKAKIPIAMQAAREKWSPLQTDRLVKVDDTAALAGLAVLDTYRRDKRRETTETIANDVLQGANLIDRGFQFLAALSVVALLLYALFFLLQNELRQTIGKLSTELADRLAAEHETKKFQRAVDQSPATIIITDTESRIEYVNDKFCSLTGYRPDEVIGKTPSILQSGDVGRETYTSLRHQLARGEEWHGTFRNVKKNGDVYWAKTAILPLRDDGDRITHFIGLGEDDTERQKAREQMHRAQKMEAVGLLASGVAHDFNNILTTILGNVHLARLDAPAEGAFADDLEQIEIAAKRAQNLADQVLAFAQRRPGAPESLAVAETIDEVARLMRASILPNISIDCRVDDAVWVLADPTRLHQVVMNLCSNAAEAIGPAGGKITVRAGRLVAPNGADGDGVGQVYITIADDGPGIAEDVRDQIFDPFFTTKPAGKGTGLGLSVVANLVSDMNGRISVRSTPGAGTSFELILPEAEPVSRAAVQREEFAAGTGTVLLIDDDPHVLATCAKLLRRLAYKVEDFSDPAAAMDAFVRHPGHYALVMTDFIMPEMDGAQVCDTVRGLRRDCPIIVYSAYQPETLELDRLQPIQLLEKPIDPRSLSRTVSSLLKSDAAD